MPPRAASPSVRQERVPVTFLSQFYQVKSKRPVPTRESHGWKEMCADAVTVIPNCAQRIKKRQHKTSTGTARQKCVRAHWYLVPCRQVFPVIPSPRSSLRLQQKRPMRNVSLTRHLPVGLFFFHFIQMFPSSHFPFHSIPFWIGNVTVFCGRERTQLVRCFLWFRTRTRTRCSGRVLSYFPALRHNQWRVAAQATGRAESPPSKDLNRL